MDRVTVLGSGMAGCGAINVLSQAGVDSVVYDKNEYWGGHTATFTFEGRYVFDDGPHISFTQAERLQDLFAGAVDGEYETIQAYVNNYWRGHWPRHPVQANLHGLPPDLLIRCIQDFVAAAAREPGRVHNYRDWLYAQLGKTLAETFPMVYGHKYHTVGAEQMSTDWLGPRIYRPSLEEVLRGALVPNAGDMHYVSHFRYPSAGGFVQYLLDFRSRTQAHMGHELVQLDPAQRILSFANGVQAPYGQLISSVPLPELVRMIDDVPGDVKAAAEALACTSCVLVNVVIDRRDGLSDAHWTYFYDPDIVFARLSFPHLFSPNNTTEGTGSIQAEVYYSKKYRPLNHPPADEIDPVLAALRRTGYITEDDTVLFTNAWVVPYANIIFDLDRADALATVHGFLDELNIIYCGRYGRWGYQWTDQAFVSGEKAAEAALDRLGQR